MSPGACGGLGEHSKPAKGKMDIKMRKRLQMKIKYIILRSIFKKLELLWEQSDTGAPISDRYDVEGDLVGWEDADGYQNVTVMMEQVIDLAEWFEHPDKEQLLRIARKLVPQDSEDLGEHEEICDI